jgi:hypothetical protein
MQTLYEPWAQAEPFRFTPEFVTRWWRVLMVDNPNKFCTNNPKDWVFVNRLQWGLYAVLALGASADFRSAILELLPSRRARTSAKTRRR